MIGFSLSPGGLLLPYHLGVLFALSYHRHLTADTPLAGSSAGAIAVAAHATGVPTAVALEASMRISAQCTPWCQGLSFGAMSSRRTWMKRVTIVIGGILTTESRIFVEDRTAKAAINNEPNQLKFRAPTEDQPQISLPTRPVEDEPLVQGLVYYKDPKAERPSPDSVVILTVRKASDPDTVLLAAKIPLASQRLPLQFRFPKPADTTNLSSEDLIVQAQVCMPENVDRTTKSCTKTVMTGLGIGKALQFTSPDDPSQKVSLRAGVSIALENVQQQ